MNFSNEKVIGQVIDIPNDDILPNRFQPRKYFDEVETLELADSIKEHGILQPIVVRQVGDKYEIIAGERRFKANILAGNDSIPAIINDLDDKGSSEISIIENIQRQNLTPIEEAISYKRIIDMGYLTQEQLARKIGKSQSAIANKIRLLKLSDNVQDALMEKKISERHARSLLKLESLKDQDELLEKIIKERLTVRKTDEEIRKMNNEVINNNISNMQGELPVGMNQPMMNNQAPEPLKSQPVNQNIFGSMNDTPIFNSEPDIPTSSVSPIMGAPISSFAVEDPNTSDDSDNEGGIKTTINNPVESVPTMDNNIAGVMNSNDTLNSMSTNPQPEMVQPIVNNTPTDTVQTPSNLDIFNNQPIASPEPTITNPISQADYIEPVSEISNNLNTIQPISAPIQQTPITTSPITEEPQPNSLFNVNPIVTEPISSIDTVSPEPVQDQPLQSNSISQFNLNNDSLNSNAQPFQPIPDQIQPNPVVEQPSTPFGTIQPISNEPMVELTPSNPQPANNIETPISNVSDPIIVSNDDNQFDPIMPEKTAAGPTLDFKTIINLVRQCSQTIEKCGYVIDTEEIDMGEKYQITFTIDK